MRKPAAVALAILPLLLGGCGEQAGTEDLLFLRTPNGVAVAAAGARSSPFRAPAVPSSDWSSVVRARTRGASTRVVALDPSSGRELWTRSVDGRLQVKVVSTGGDHVALVPRRQSYYRQGRGRTTFVIVTRDAEARTIELDGNFEPEAFSTDGGSLFVLEYLPARAPTSYRVRRLDLDTGRVQGVYTVDEELQEAMRGTARVQATSPDGRRLYTLYTLGGGGAPRRAFVHVLSLDELWAHCVDLPAGFTASADSATVLTTTPDGDSLYAANSVTGAIAEIDTQALRVARTGRVNFGLGDAAHAVFARDGTLYLASGRRVTAVDAADLSEKRAWLTKVAATGIQVGRDARRIYVGLRREIAVLDAVTGARAGTFDVPGIKRIVQLGRVTRPVDEAMRKITCAC